MPFDREELEEEYEDDMESLARMIEIFDRDCQQRLEKLRSAVESGDCSILESEAHALKGGVGNFFATDVFASLQRLETIGNEQDIAEAAATLATVEEDLQVFRNALGEMLDDLK